MGNAEYATLDALARAHALTVERNTFDAGQTVTVHGAIGRLPYRIRITREWGDDETAEEVARQTLEDRLASIPGHVDASELFAFEDGQLDEDALVSLFQRLVDSGMAWQLQGFYGRTAQRLIEQGLVVPKRNT